MLGVGWRVNVKDGERDGIKVRDVDKKHRKKGKEIPSQASLQQGTMVGVTGQI